MNFNEQVLRGNWKQLKGEVKAKWASLTDDDLQFVDGNVDKLIGKIQQKTGEAKSAIEEFFGDALSAADNQASQTNSSNEPPRDFTARAGNQLRRGYSQAETAVHNYPGSSVAMALGCGVVVGLLIGSSLAARR